MTVNFVFLFLGVWGSLRIGVLCVKTVTKLPEGAVLSLAVVLFQDGLGILKSSSFDINFHLGNRRKSAVVTQLISRVAGPRAVTKSYQLQICAPLCKM